MSDEKRAKKFGRRVRELRELRSLTQEELAERSGLNRTTVVSVERGERKPFPSTRRKLAHGLGIPVEELWN